MTHSRAGEPGNFHFRSDRFCQINGLWYFVTREKTQEGPFQTRVDADAGAAKYIERARARS